MVAQVAAEEPDTEPKIPQPRMVAGDAVQPGTQAFKHFLAELGAKQDLAHPDEERQGRELPAGVAFPEGAEQVLARLRAGEKGLPDPAANGQRHRDPHAARQQQHHEQQQDAAHHQSIHVVIFLKN
jgi:hypothetical protein